MYESVLSILNNYEPIWSGIPKFASAVQEFNTEMEYIRVKSMKQQCITVGVAKARNNKYAVLVDDLNIVANALFVFATSTNHFELAKRNKIAVSKLKGLSISVRVIMINQLKEDLNTYSVELEAYGLTPAYQLSFNDKIESYRTFSNEPRMKLIERKGITSDLGSHEYKIDNLLKWQLDKLIIQFKLIEPGFIQAYSNARLIIDLRGPTHNHGTTSE